MRRINLQNGFLSLLLVLFTAITACKKDHNDVNPPVDTGTGTGTQNPYADTSGALKSISTGFPFGMAVEYNLATANAKYWATVKREAAIITFGNEMKNSSLLKDDGTYNFATADAFYNMATAAGLQVYGHTLVWHSQQNTNYYNKLISGGNSTVGSNLLTNGDFETGTGTDGWAAYNGATSFSITTTAAEVHGGSKALKVVVASDNPGKQYVVQYASPLVNTTAGNTYKVALWVKGSAAVSGAFRLSTQNSGGGNASYQADQDVSTAWTQYSWTFTAKDPQTHIMLDMGQKAVTYLVDDITVQEVTAGGALTGQALVDAVDNAMKTHIQTVVGHYAGKVKQWDVINEPFIETGDLRDNNNTTQGSGIFVWQNYLGRGYAAKAFNYAHAADPTADLFMNDYNLESSPAKLAAFVQLANDLKSAGAPINGVGTQMHMSIATSKPAIDNMFKALAGTGLKVRISELDIRVNPSDLSNFTLNSTLTDQQAAMYQYVVSSYLANVPAGQRAGITVWGVDDSTSWIITAQKKTDYPLLFNSDFSKKSAYAGVKLGLQGKTP